MAKTNTGLVSYALAQLGKPYWYGCFGQKGTAALLTAKARQYPTMYTTSRVYNCRKQYGVKVHDCVGLIKGYLWCDSNTDDTPKYVAAQDKSAGGMYNACKIRGYMNTMPDIPGILVFLPGHVGVYIGGGYVVEASGFSKGVIKTKLAGRGWERWGKCPYITYTGAETPTTGENKPETTVKSSFKVGDTVKVKAGAKSYEGKSLSNTVYNKSYVIDELKGKRAVLDLKGICTAVNTDDLTLVSNAGGSSVKTPKVGAKVKITGKYASSASANSAANSAGIGRTGYIVKIHTNKAYPYQIGAEKGNTESSNTIGFAKASAFELV